MGTSCAFVNLLLIASGIVLVASAEDLPNEDASIKYDGAQLFRISIDEGLRKILDDLEDSGTIQKWGGSAAVQDVMVRAGKVDEFVGVLQTNNATYHIILDDVQRAISSENPEPSDPEHNLRDKPYRLSWLRYHRYDDHLEFLGYLQNTYPNIVNVIEIGRSVEGRPIKVIKISSGQPNAKAMWIDGGTHAREWITTATTTYIIRELVEDRLSNKSSLPPIDFYISPLINPDGYEYSHTVDRLWRKNRSKRGGSCQGTDLNRNWGYRWGGAGSSRQPCKEIYAGTEAFSEPETKAVSNFILSQKDSLKAYVTFHSYGQYILYPWGYAARVPPDYTDMDRVARQAANAIQKAGGPAYTVGNSASTLYAASGGADDWAKGAAGIKYSYTIELRDNGIYGFVLPAQFIEPCGKESLAAVKVIAEAASNA